jgi:hypothetical protein
MTTNEQLDRLAGIVASLSGAVVAHDDKIEAHDRQIEALITIGEQQSQRLDKLLVLTEQNAENWKNLERQWQAYLNTLPRH